MNQEAEMFNEDQNNLDWSPSAMIREDQLVQEAGFSDIITRFTVVSNGVGLPAAFIAAEHQSKGTMGAVIIVPRAACAFITDNINAVKRMHENLRAENGDKSLRVSDLLQMGFVRIGL